MIKYLTSALASPSGTTKTSGNSISVPAGTKKILGVWAYVSGPGLTTLECVSGKFNLESSDLPEIQPCEIPIAITNVVTSGVGVYEVKVWPLNTPVPAGAAISITGYFTLDMALTVVETGRWGLVIEV